MDNISVQSDIYIIQRTIMSLVFSGYAHTQLSISKKNTGRELGELSLVSILSAELSIMDDIHVSIQITDRDEIKTI